MNIRKTITSEIEWNTIKKAQADGKLQELLQVLPSELQQELLQMHRLSVLLQQLHCIHCH